MISAGARVVCFAVANPGKDIFLEMLEIELELPNDAHIRLVMAAEAQRLGLQISKSRLAELQPLAGRNPMLARKIIKNEALGIKQDKPEHTQYVDPEKYGESWHEAASYFQGAVSTEQWISSMESVRNPLGQKLSRSLKSKQYHTSLPGAPDGEYVVIQFNTSFSHKLSAVETVTPMNEQDGQWRVSGYYIK